MAHAPSDAAPAGLAATAAHAFPGAGQRGVHRAIHTLNGQGVPGAAAPLAAPPLAGVHRA